MKQHTRVKQAGEPAYKTTLDISGLIGFKREQRASLRKVAPKGVATGFNISVSDAITIARAAAWVLAVEDNGKLKVQRELVSGSISIGISFEQEVASRLRSSPASSIGAPGSLDFFES